MKVLLLDDDADITALVCDEFGARGLTVTAISTVAAGLRAVAETDFDVAVIDIRLPDGSGLDVLRAIRERGAATHVLILSGAVSEQDRVTAFDMSADDYVVKPFYVSELCARVIAFTRNMPADGDAKVSFGERLTIDLRNRDVCVDGVPIDLSTREFDLLSFLATRPGHVFSRAQLLRLVWVSESKQRSDNTVADHIYRLRNKIEVDRANPQILRTVRGGGYTFQTPDRATRLNTLAEESGVVIHDGASILSIDDVGVRLFGYERDEELIGVDPIKLVSSTSYTALRSRVERLESSANVAPQLLEMQRSDGTTLQAEVSTSETQWHGARAWKVVVMPIASSAARLLHLATGVVTSISDAVIVTDLSGYVRGWNPAAERAYGWEQTSAMGRQLSDIVPWVGDGADFTLAWAAILKVGTWHGEVRQLCRDLRVATALASASEVLDETGRHVAVVFTFRSSDHLPSERSPKASDAELADLRRGIDNGEIVVHYQTLVDLKTGTVVGVEALARWEHPTRGLLTPDAFLTAAEQSGLIVDLGRTVRHQAMAQLALWRARGLDIHVAINLSGRELADTSLVKSITEAIAGYEIDAGSVWFEVTETAIVEDVGAAGVALSELANAGVHISIDDFGTGWGSLVYLRNFPITALKIDRSFVAGLPSNVEDAAICRSVVGLGAELGLFVVGEGIETVAQRDTLIALGCRVGQGYYFSLPKSAEQVSFSRVQLGVVTRRSEDNEGSVGHTARARREHRLQKASASVSVMESVLTNTSPATPEAALADARHDLLWATSVEEVEDAAFRFVRSLGGQVVPANDLSARDSLPTNLALAGGPPQFATAAHDGIARMLLERYLPVFVADAERAVALALRTETLWRDAAGDALTGIANRRYLDRAIARAHHGDVLVMIDLDNFKDLNDRHGHAAGDEVLRLFGRMLREEVRADDLAGRFGGEEFLLLLRGPAAPAPACARLREKWIGIRESPTTFSAGWAIVAVDELPSDALERADRSLYEAKRAGRDCARGTLDETVVEADG
jgi:diguanylate cyclase (GGDEF)-like protein/PAS domain S-box-containing protein